MQRPQEEQRRHEVPRDADGEGETSQAKKHDPYNPPGEDRDEGIPGRNNIGNGPILYQQEIGERSWEQCFRDIQQELSHMKETVKGRAPVSVDALVPVHGWGTTLPSPCEVQNASDRNIRRNEIPCRPPQYLQKSDGATRIPGPCEV